MRYAIGPPRQRAGAHRRYTEADIATLERMIGLVEAGATPAGAARQALAEADPAPPDRSALLAAAEKLEPDVALTLIMARLAGDGVVATWNRLCRPAFAAIVTGQRSGRGLVEVEHLLSWATIAALHRMFPPARRPRSQTPISAVRRRDSGASRHRRPHVRETEIVAQRGPGVLGAQHAALLQQRHHLVDEFVQTPGHQM